MKPILILLFGTLLATTFLSKKRVLRPAREDPSLSEIAKMEAIIADLEDALKMLDAKAPVAKDDDIDKRYFTSRTGPPKTYLH